MTFLFALGKYTLLPIICDWLTLVDFVRLDCSVTNRHQCRNLQRLCWDHNSMFQSKLLDSEIIELHPSQSAWMRKMNLVAHTCEITETTFIKPIRPSRISRLMAWIKGEVDPRSSIVSLYANVANVKLTGSLQYELRKEFVELLEACPKISELAVDAPDFMFMVLGNLVRHPLPIKSLRILRPCRYEMLTSILTFCCSSLLEIHLDNNYSTSSYRTWLFIIVWCRNIHTVNMDVDVRSMTLFAFHAGQKSRYLNVLCDDTQLRTLLWYRCDDTLAQLTLNGNIHKLETGWSVLLRSLCPSLCKLTLFVDKLFGQALMDIAEHLPNLKEFNCIFASIDLHCVEYLFSSSLPVALIKMSAFMSESVILQVKSFCPVLTLDIRCSHLSDDGLLLIAQYCPLVTDLSLHMSMFVTDEGLLSIIKNRRLKTLVLRGCHLHTETLLNLSQYCAGLEHVEVPVHCTIKGIVALIENCQCLRRLICKNKPGMKEALNLARKINPKLRITMGDGLIIRGSGVPLYL